MPPCGLTQQLPTKIENHINDNQYLRYAGEGAAVVAAQKGAPGGHIVETYQLTATVTAVDPATRKVTLVTPAGRETVFKAGRS